MENQINEKEKEKRNLNTGGSNLKLSKVNSRLESVPVKEKEKEKRNLNTAGSNLALSKEKEKEKRNLNTAGLNLTLSKNPKNYEMDRFLSRKMEERKKLDTGSSFTLFGRAIPMTDSSSSMVLTRNRTYEVPGSSTFPSVNGVGSAGGKENVLPVGVGSAGGSLLALGSEVLNQPTWVNKGIAGEDVVELLQFSHLCLTNKKMGIFIQSPVGDAVSGKVLFSVGKTACEYFTALGKEFGNAWTRVAGSRTITSRNGEIDVGYSYYYRSVDKKSIRFNWYKEGLKDLLLVHFIEYEHKRQIKASSRIPNLSQMLQSFAIQIPACRVSSTAAKESFAIQILACRVSNTTAKETGSGVQGAESKDVGIETDREWKDQISKKLKRQGKKLDRLVDMVNQLLKDSKSRHVTEGL